MISPSTLKEDPLVSQWYSDLYRSATISRNRWFLVGVIALSLVVIEALALIFLTPLKTVEPYLLQVDSQTGVTTILQPLREKNEVSLTENEAITKSFLVRYILSRETYDLQDLNRNYDLVRLMSSSEEVKKFEEAISTIQTTHSSEARPTRFTRTVKISSVTFLDQKKKTAQIRFTTIETELNQKTKEESWIAILTFRYVSSPMEESDRLQNPLGFQVIAYRIDQEIVP